MQPPAITFSTKTFIHIPDSSATRHCLDAPCLPQATQSIGAIAYGIPVNKAQVLNPDIATPTPIHSPIIAKGSPHHQWRLHHAAGGILKMTSTNFPRFILCRRVSGGYVSSVSVRCQI